VQYQFQFDAVFDAWPLLLQGTWITIRLSFTAMLLGLVVALFFLYQYVMQRIRASRQQQQEHQCDQRHACHG